MTELEWHLTQAFTRMEENLGARLAALERWMEALKTEQSRIRREVQACGGLAGDLESSLRELENALNRLSA